ncbi:MAG: c-type cytochrome [Gammaproteobacteria bacterium]
MLKPSTLIIILGCLTAGPVLAESVIEQRQAAFDTIKKSMANVKDALKQPDFGAARTNAVQVLDQAKAVTKLFPEGSYEGDTRAKKKIWEKADDFQARQQTLIENSEALVSATETGDAKQLKSAFKAVSKDCKGCHMRYRQVF